MPVFARVSGETGWGIALRLDAQVVLVQGTEGFRLEQITEGLAARRNSRRSLTFC